MNLLHITDLGADDIRTIWSLAGRAPRVLQGTVGWSFEGNGIRTRTTFLQAFRSLGLAVVELPNLLKTAERAQDLAGYLDPFYDLYVVRDGNHARLCEFAAASCRPVVNAMSAQGHPCEVLSDAYALQARLGDLRSLRIGLWGPTTNVLRSWHELAGVLGVELHHFAPASFHDDTGRARFSTQPDRAVDVLVTDGWPAGFDDTAWSLTARHLQALGDPLLLPTPPFSIGRELAFDPVTHPRFAGYEQKRALLDVQRALVAYLLGER